jgi:hypothetical protein
MTFTDNGDGTATLTGTPTGAGSFPLALTATNAAGSDTQTLTVTVSRIAVTGTASSSVPSAVFGQSALVTVVLAAERGPVPEGSVQFEVDGLDLGGPVAVAEGRVVSADLAGLAPGAHTVSYVFTPTSGSSTTAAGSLTQVVSEAGTTLAVRVGPSTITATVAVTAPGAGTPTGPVTFTVEGLTVGSAQLVDGVATLAYAVPASRSQAVAAGYEGDSRFTGSSASTSTGRLSIVATVSSASAKTSFGWYRERVTISYVCTVAAAPLTTPCPAPVRLGRALGESRTATITATDGSIATAVVTGLKIDRYEPILRVKRVGGSLRCVATDRLSGVDSCVVVKTVRGGVTTYKAVAEDKAGNRAVRRGTVRR